MWSKRDIQPPILFVSNVEDASGPTTRCNSLADD